MPDVKTNGIQIEYKTFGDRSSPALLLAGNGAQMIVWDVDFCELLARRIYWTLCECLAQDLEPRISVWGRKSTDLYGKELLPLILPAGDGAPEHSSYRRRRSKEVASSIKAPILVIHGSDDPLVPVEGGEDTALVIPGAKLLDHQWNGAWYSDMGLGGSSECHRSAYKPIRLNNLIFALKLRIWYEGRKK